MKKIKKALLMILVTFSYSTIQAQNANNPWQFSFAVSAVDLDADTNTQFDEFFAIDENWNVSNGVSMFTLSKYLGDNLSLGLSGSVNSISKFADGFEFVNDVKYFAGDLMLKYSLSEALGCETMEPYVGLGVGNTRMDAESWMTTNASLGMNYWMSDVWGLTAQVDYKINMSENGRESTSMLDEGGSMRYSIGVSMKFGGSDKE